MNKKPKLVYGIKGKLVSAACMLLVAVIMVVSSTYAWFTLSTAPEVTGISTAVGANGSLEMALMPESGTLADITTATTVTNTFDANTTWGNLVDLSLEEYGLDKIILYPAMLNEADNGGVNLNSYLKTPSYGADGRIKELLANTSASTYGYDSTNNFPVNTKYGVRAIGVASGMTDRQLDYRNAKYAASTAAASAKNQASVSLNTNGAALANLAIMHAADANAKFTSTQMQSLQAIINDLTKANGVLDQIENAYIQYVLAYAASAITGEDNTVWTTVQNLVANTDSYTALKDAMGSNWPTAAMTDIDAAMAKLTATRGNVDTAKTTIDELVEANREDIQWSEFSAALQNLADVDEMKINGYAVSGIMNNLSAIVNDVTAGKGLTVTMATGAGVYADIADHCGDYRADVTIQGVSYNGITLDTLKAKMETKTTENPTLIAKIGAQVDAYGAPGGTGAEKPLTEFYGYIIDLAFRTNAAESNLLLQTEPEDRIYADDNTNEETMGHGSTMTFASQTTEFTTDQVIELMKALRVVFFEPTTGAIYANAKLDMGDGAYKVVGEDVTGELYIYKKATAYTYEEGGTTTTYYMVDNTYYSDSTCTADKKVELTSDVVENLQKTETTVEVKRTGKDAIITALNQNQPAAVSVLVYLDGADLENADVAATGAESMSGTMNLQFASSATLVPMEYAGLHTPGTTPGTDAGEGTNP